VRKAKEPLGILPENKERFAILFFCEDFKGLHGIGKSFCGNFHIRYVKEPIIFACSPGHFQPMLRSGHVKGILVRRSMGRDKDDAREPKERRYFLSQPKMPQMGRIEGSTKYSDSQVHTVFKERACFRK
jgi:hypothetical protein